MAGILQGALLAGLAACIFVLSLGRRPNPPPSVLHLPTPGAAEPPPSAKPKRQTAFPPPSSVCHYFHRAPSSDGAPFFAHHSPGTTREQGCRPVSRARAPWRPTVPAHPQVSPPRKRGPNSHLAPVAFRMGALPNQRLSGARPPRIRPLQRSRPCPRARSNGRSLRWAVLRPRSSPRARPFPSPRM
jgi:hypothetical protein